MKKILRNFIRTNVSIKLTILATIIYITVQIILTGGLRDGVFDGLLLVATLFLIVRMDSLRSEFKNSSDAFYINLYKKNNALENRDDDVKKIFYNRSFKIWGYIYGILVGFFVFIININYLSWSINLCLCVYLFFMNYFTGVAVAKLFQYFKISKKWTSNISFSMPSCENFEIGYIRKIRNKVLFIAIVYCFFSQVSIIFSSIHINSLIYFYAGFSVLLVLSIVFYSEAQISRLKKQSFNSYMDVFNKKISEFYNEIFEKKDLSITPEDMDRIHTLLELKENFVTSYNMKFDFNVLWSSCGLIFTAIAPVLLQFLIEKI